MGVAVDNATKQETFMKMVELHPGSGTNGGKFKLILIFETEARVQNLHEIGLDSRTQRDGGGHTGQEGWPL